MSAYCAKCWKLMFKSKEVTLWKYAVSAAFKGEKESCAGKIVKLYRTDRFVTARCLECDYHVRRGEFKVERTTIINPRTEPVKSVWKIAT